MAVELTRETVFGGPLSPRFVPPRGFVPAEGVRMAWALGEGPFPPRTPDLSRKRKPRDRRSVAQKNGLRYEAKVQKHMKSLLGPEYRPGQWLKFMNERGLVRWCQADGVLVRGPEAIVFEVKYTYCLSAWFQLRLLYQPVVKRAFYTTHERLCVITRNFDPSVQFPEPVILLDSIPQWINDPQGSELVVFSWKG